MIKTFFKNLAETENGTFYFNDENIAIGGGVRSPNVTFSIKFEYKGNEIIIINRTGFAYVGSIHCTLSRNLKPIEFEINSISHLKNFFLRRKSRFEIEADNDNIKYFLENNNSIKKLSKIANKEDFSPIIICDPNDTKSIETRYHLEFDNWTEVLEPLIELYKNLIDEFEEQKAYISAKAYREMK